MASIRVWPLHRTCRDQTQNPPILMCSLYIEMLSHSRLVLSMIISPYQLLSPPNSRIAPHNQEVHNQLYKTTYRHTYAHKHIDKYIYIYKRERALAQGKDSSGDGVGN